MLLTMIPARTLPLLILSWFVLACSPSPEAPPEQQQGPQVTPVGLGQVETTPILDTSRFIASLDSRQSAEVSPQVSGRVDQVYVDFGDQVAAGTPLVQIDPTQVEADLDRQTAGIAVAEAAVEAAKAALETAKAERSVQEANLEFWEDKAVRDEDLYDAGVLPLENLQDTRRQLQVAQSNLVTQDQLIQERQTSVQQAERDLEQVQASITVQQVELDRFAVVAPFAGIVGEVPVKVGNYVSPQTILTTISVNQPLEVFIEIPIEQADRVRINQTQVELLDQAGDAISTFPVSFISPTINADTQTISVKGIYPNANNRFRADSLVPVRVIWGTELSAVVPISAVSRIAAQSFVFKAQQGQGADGQPALIASQIPVQLGRIEGNSYQVLSGLEPGEQIVVSGLQKIFDGAPIVDEVIMQQQMQQQSPDGGPPGSEPGAAEDGQPPGS